MDYFCSHELSIDAQLNAVALEIEIFSPKRNKLVFLIAVGGIWNWYCSLINLSFRKLILVFTVY